jgi:hypothetical protein
MLDLFTQNSFIISQILVWIAIFTDFLWFQFKERKKVLLVLTLSVLLIALHYLFLNELNAFYLMMISMVSFLVSSFTYNKKIMMLFFVLYLFPIILNYTSWLDVILFIARYLMLIAIFLKNDKHLRILFMWATCFTIIFNILVFTPVWVLLEVIFLGSNILGYFKHYIKKDKVLITE